MGNYSLALNVKESPSEERRQGSAPNLVHLSSSIVISSSSLKELDFGW